MELAVFELSHIDATVILLPFKLARPVDEVILEVTGQDSDIGMHRSISLFLTIAELSKVSEAAIEFLVISEAVHATVQKFSLVDLSGG